MHIDQFDYQLPAELIAQYPLAKREASRLLWVQQQRELEDKYIYQLPTLLQAGDLLVLNQTRVIPARLFTHKKTGGRVEIMVERVLSEQRMLVQLGASKATKVGDLLYLDDQVVLTVHKREGRFYELAYDGCLQLVLAEYGHIPLPPYIKRADEPDDASRYQTVFACEDGAVAAPTAGLHFSHALLAQLEDMGVPHVSLTLHVGAGTFQPIQVEEVSDHLIHAEAMSVSAEVVAHIKHTQAKGGRIIAVGTTVVRALETAAQSGRLLPFTGDTDIFIYPNFKFRVVDMMITNFHLPKSSLLLLVSAFAGIEQIKTAYTYAIDQCYRFYSYGDAMLLERDDHAV